MPALEEVQQYAQQNIYELQSRLQGCLQTDVSIVVDWATFEQFVQQDMLALSYEVLCSWNGFLVLGKVVDAIQSMIDEFGGNARGEIARQLAQVRLQCIANPPPPKPVGKELTTQEKHKQKLEEAENPTKPVIFLRDGALTICVQLGIGAAGVSSFSYVKETLNALFSVSVAHFKSVLEARIAKTQEEIKTEVGDPTFDVEIVFDWESFQNAGKMDQALNNMARWDCWYSLHELPRAFRWVKSDFSVSQERLKKSIKKVVFSNAEDDGIEKRYWHSYALLTNGTLELRGVYREWWGYIYSYDITRAVGYGCALDEADEAFESNSALDSDTLDRCVRAIREICSHNAIRYGNMKPILDLSKRKCFPVLDEVDSEAVETCLNTYYKEVMCKKNKKDDKKDDKKDKKEKKEEDDEDGDEPVHEQDEENQEEQQEYKEGDKFPETVLKGYNVNKTNFRGQVQARLAVITNKALYTFAYDYKKKELTKRRAHRYTFDKLYSTRYGPLKEDLGSVAGGGVAGAVANAAADAMKDLSNYGLKIYTNIITSRKEVFTEKAISKAVKKFVFKVLKFLADGPLKEAIGSEKEPTVDIPGLPKFNSPAFLLRVAATSLYKDRVEAQTSIGGLQEANIAHELEMAAEMFDTLSETIELDLPNLPNMKLVNLLSQICDILDQNVDNMDLNIPSSFTISSLIRNINYAVYSLERSGSSPTLSFDQPKALPYAEMCAMLKTSLENYKNKTEFDNTAIKMLGNGQSFPKIDELVDQLSQLSGLPDIQFDPYPPVLVSAILKAIAGYLGKYNMPGFNLLELKIPGLSLPGLPRINLPSVPLPGILGRLKPPSEPSREEFIVQINNPHKELSKFLSAQFCYLIYAASMADQYPYWPWSPYETSYVSVPVSVVSMVYNKSGGKGNKEKK